MSAMVIPMIRLFFLRILNLIEYLLYERGVDEHTYKDEEDAYRGGDDTQGLPLPMVYWLAG